MPWNMPDRVWWVGLKLDGSGWQAFRCVYHPVPATHGRRYAYVVGPMTRRGALWAEANGGWHDLKECDLRGRRWIDAEGPYVLTNGHWREVDGGCFQYLGNTYNLADFVPVGQAEPALAEWEAYMPQSAWDSIVIRYGDQRDMVQAGRYISD